ncbi:hypothetical protein EON63_02490 [archaeon]|nr:MAG: hypothetical protein EON63_02490 [archaeon]
MVMSRVYFFFLCFFIAFSVTSGGKGLALIVNGKLFHYEVASFFADHLRVLDYSIQIWLTQNNAKNPMMAKAGYEFLQDYAKDIRFLPDHSQAMTKAMELPRERIKLLVHINADENTDFRQLCQLNLHDSLMQKAEKVIMVVHYAGV